MQIYNELKAALTADVYDCRRVISVLKEIDEYKAAYASLNSKKISYSLEEHTIMVCELFENYIAESYDDKVYSMEAFRLLLCLHDIGKPISLLNSDKEHQWKYTVEMIEKNREKLPFSIQEFKCGVALISDDPLGLYIRNKITKDEAETRIRVMVNNSDTEIEGFLKLLCLYYQVDAGAYTSEGYIGAKEEFFEKPKLEAVFKKNSDNKLCFSKKLGRFVFADIIEDRVALLYEGLRNG